MAKVKLKTNRGAAKRFKKTGSGRYKHRRSTRAHILTKRTTKNKRHLRSTKLVAKVDTNMVDRMLKEK